MALTDLYVSDAGAGAHDGTTAGNAFSFTEMVADINLGGKAGNRYNVIKGAGAIARTTTTDTISGSGTATSPVIIRGYTTTITDGYQGRTAGAGLVTTNMPSITYTTGRMNMTGTFIILEALNISGAPSAAVVTLAGDSVAKSCAIVNSSTNAAASGINTAGNRTIFFDCDATLTGASGGNYALGMQGNGAKAIANRVKGGPNMGILCNATSVVILNTVYVSAGPVISMNSTGGGPLIAFNTVVGGTGDGIDIVTGTTGLQCIIGNMLTDNGGYGLDMVSAANAAFVAYNRTRDNTSGAINSGTDWVAATSYGNVTTDTGGAETDYTDSGSNDYRLIAASPATSAAQPASASIGALQRDQTSAGSTASAYAFVG